MHEVTIHNCRGLMPIDTHIADVAQRLRRQVIFLLADHDTTNTFLVATPLRDDLIALCRTKSKELKMVSFSASQS